MNILFAYKKIEWKNNQQGEDLNEKN